jgi:hypothetical protein
LGFQCGGRVQNGVNKSHVQWVRRLTEHKHSAERRTEHRSWPNFYKKILSFWQGRGVTRTYAMGLAEVQGLVRSSEGAFTSPALTSMVNSDVAGLL